MGNVVEFREICPMDVVQLTHVSDKFVVSGVVNGIGWTPGTSGNNSVTLRCGDDNQYRFFLDEFEITNHHRPLIAPEVGKFLRFWARDSENDDSLGVWDGGRFRGTNKNGGTTTIMTLAGVDWEYV